MATPCSHCGHAHAEAKRCPSTGRRMAEPGLCGQVLDRYKVIEWIGGGGFGGVYRAEHTVMHRAVALKVMHEDHGTDQTMVDRFIRESQAASAVGSPHIVTVFDAGTTPDGDPFIAMEQIDGCALNALITGGKSLPVPRALRIGVQILDALAAAHAAGIIHRDIKPANIMLAGTDADQAGGDDFVKIVDFGISKVDRADKTLTRSEVTMGTPGFAAPEQYMSARTVDERADIYAWSAVLFRMLSGHNPFEDDTYEKVVIAVCTKAPPKLRELAPHVPEAVANVIDRGLSPAPDDRWRSAEEVAAAIQRACEAEGIEIPTIETPRGIMTRVSSVRPEPLEATPTLPAAQTGPKDAPPTRMRTWVLVGAVVLIAVGIAIPLMLKNSEPTQPIQAAEVPTDNQVTPELGDLRADGTETETVLEPDDPARQAPASSGSVDPTASNAEASPAPGARKRERRAPTKRAPPPSPKSLLELDPSFE